MGLKPKVRIVCPVCALPMRFTCIVQEANEVRWALSPISREHLAKANCQPPKPVVLSLVPDELKEPLAA